MVERTLSPGDRRRFAAASIAVSLFAFLVLAFFGALTPERFFVVSFVGYLLLVEVTESSYLDAPWRQRLAWPTLLGYGLVALLVVRYVYRVVQSAIG